VTADGTAGAAQIVQSRRRHWARNWRSERSLPSCPPECAFALCSTAASDRGCVESNEAHPGRRSDRYCDGRKRRPIGHPGAGQTPVAAAYTLDHDSGRRPKALFQSVAYPRASTSLADDLPEYPCPRGPTSTAACGRHPEIATPYVP
jgi:hypothetical protein